MINKRSLAIGTLLAAGAGYIAGLLTAPKSGREARKDIHKAAQSAKSEAERKLKQAHSELSKLQNDATKLFEKSKGKVNTEFSKARKNAEVVGKKARLVLSAVHEGEDGDKDLQNAISDVKKATSHLKKFVTKKV